MFLPLVTPTFILKPLSLSCFINKFFCIILLMPHISGIIFLSLSDLLHLNKIIPHCYKWYYFILFMAEYIPLHMDKMYHIFFIHSSVDSHPIKLQDTKLINRNFLHSYILTMKDKEKLRR